MDISKATSLADFLSDISDSPHDFEPPESDYKLVFWDGEERVPLVIEGIDHVAKCITFGDVRRWDPEFITPAQAAAICEVQQGMQADVADFHRLVTTTRAAFEDKLAEEAGFVDYADYDAYWNDLLFEGAPRC